MVFFLFPLLSLLLCENTRPSFPLSLPARCERSKRFLVSGFHNIPRDTKCAESPPAGFLVFFLKCRRWWGWRRGCRGWRGSLKERQAGIERAAKRRAHFTHLGLLPCCCVVTRLSCAVSSLHKEWVGGRVDEMHQTWVNQVRPACMTTR